MNFSRLIQAAFSLFFSSEKKPPVQQHHHVSASHSQTKPAGSKKKPASLQTISARYEEELMNRTFHYTLQDARGRREKVQLIFEPGNFCHLFSIASIADKICEDPGEYSGMQGWKNIKNGKITLAALQKMDPEDFEFYQQEFCLFDELLQTIRNPRVVRYDPKKVPGSRLKVDLLFYGQFQGQVIHLALSKDQDGTYFPRSFFVRQEKQDRAHPTKYIEPMEKLKVIKQMSIKKA